VKPEPTKTPVADAAPEDADPFAGGYGFSTEDGGVIFRGSGGFGNTGQGTVGSGVGHGIGGVRSDRPRKRRK
jgi:hypothetical protein